MHAKVRKSDPIAWGPPGGSEKDLGTLMALFSFFIAAAFLGRMVLGLLNPVSGVESFAIVPFVALFLGFGTLGLVMRLRQTSVVYVDGWAPPRGTLRRAHNHRSFLKWQEIERIQMNPSGSSMAVFLRTGESFRVKLDEVGPYVYQQLASRIPVVAANP